MEEAYAPAVSSNLSATDGSASFFKYKYAERATRDGTIPTTEELKGLCVKEMNENHKEKLQCDVQKILKEAGHTWLWTPPYCPWLQPIETFWAHGKNRAASKNRNGSIYSSNFIVCLLTACCCCCSSADRTMKQCMVHLREGWYGSDKYHQWVREGKPIGRGPGGSGEMLAVETRRQLAQHRFGKGATEDDWIPSDCCRPSDVAGLIEKAKGEAEAMIKTMDGLSGTLADLVMREGDTGAGGTATHRWVPNPEFVDPRAKLVDPHTRDMSDLTGLPQEICDLTGLSAEVVGHDDIVSAEADAAVSGSRDRPNLPAAAIDGDDDLQVRLGADAVEHCLGCGRSMPVDSEYAFCARCE
jgi:hypothetical protein